MEEKTIFKGIIIRKENINNVEWYIVKNLINTVEYKIKAIYLKFIEGIKIKNTFDFVIYKNDSKYISIINPKYPINSEINFDIVNIIEKDNKSFFELKSEYNPPLMVEAKFFQLNKINILKCKIIDYRFGRPYLLNLDLTQCPWEIGSFHFFKIQEFLIDDNNGNFNRVKIDLGLGISKVLKAGPWHNPDLWNFLDIECNIIEIYKDGLPNIKIVDSRHPKYEIGKSYHFNVVKFENRTFKNGDDFKVILLNDESNIQYDVFAFPNQENKISAGSKIECEIVNIDYKLRLKQVNNEDPFYYKFEEIEPDYAYQNKFFTPNLNNQSNYNFKLLEQYSKGSGFWIMTYMNHILPKLLVDYRKRKDLADLLLLLKLKLKINNWILKKGFLKAIRIDEERKSAKIKVKKSIEVCEIEVNVVESLIHYETHLIFKQFRKTKKTALLFYYILHSNLNSVDFEVFYQEIQNFDYQNEENLVNKYYLSRLVRLIRLKIGDVNKFIDQNLFILSNDKSGEMKETLRQSINWIFICVELSSKLNSNQDRNFYLSEIFRLYSFLTSDISIQKELLLSAFKTVSDQCNLVINPFYLDDKQTKLNLNSLFRSTSVKDSSDYLKDHYEVIITEKHFKGFAINVNDYSGYLPYEYIFDNTLKNYIPEIIKWETKVEILNQCDFFNIFICKQISNDDLEFKSKNLMLNIIEPGSIIKATIKNITDYGIFVSSSFGEGLIHITEISSDYLNKENLNEIFKINAKIPVFVIGNLDSKLELSLTRLKGTSYESEYREIMENSTLFYLEPFNDNDELTLKLEEEKGYIFDRAATLATNINDKIKYLFFSKFFFSNIKNARSYLSSIYIKYFELILSLDELLTNYSFDRYLIFKNEIIQIKKNVDLKTLENFPESKNLLFFIDILFLFNSKDENDTEELFFLTKSSKDSEDSFLIPVAKNALANNLLISEIDQSNIEELNQFTFKNLKRIREFISKGVLCVFETPEDILEKELEMKRKYWLGMIANDEGEKLEFKSTFKTPTTNKSKTLIIENIKKQISKSSVPSKIDQLKTRISELENENLMDPFIHQKLIHSSLKTICAFANTNGGHLLLGVSDDKKIHGLEQDYASFKGNDRDSFGKFFDSQLNIYFGKSFSSSLLRKEFLKFPEGDVLIIEVKPSKDEIFILKNDKGDSDESIYVRHLSSSEKLTGIELAKFIKRKAAYQQINN